MNISNALNQALSETGVSKAELARRMGKSKPYITQLCNGDRGATEEVLTAIAQCLGCQVSVDIRFHKIK